MILNSSPKLGEVARSAEGVCGLECHAFGDLNAPPLEGYLL